MQALYLSASTKSNLAFSKESTGERTALWSLVALPTPGLVTKTRSRIVAVEESHSLWYEIEKCTDNNLRSPIPHKLQRCQKYRVQYCRTNKYGNSYFPFMTRHFNNSYWSKMFLTCFLFYFIAMYFFTVTFRNTVKRIVISIPDCQHLYYY